MLHEVYAKNKMMFVWVFFFPFSLTEKLCIFNEGRRANKLQRIQQIRWLSLGMTVRVVVKLPQPVNV